MDNSTRGENFGETHFDTVGDYFKNKYVFKVIQKWYELMLRENNCFRNELKVFERKNGKKIGFSEEYEDFVRNIFDNQGSKENFLAFFKAEYIDDKRMVTKLLREYEDEDITRMFLSFDEVSNQLGYDAAGNVACRTMTSIFATEIGYVLDKAHTKNSIEEDSTTPHCGLKLMLQQRISPISADGKILTYVGEGDNGGFLVEELGDKRGILFEVKRNGFDIFDSEGDVISEKQSEDTNLQLEVLERVLKYHDDIDSIDLSEQEEEKYFNMKLMWRGVKKGISSKELDLSFRRHLLNMIDELRLKLMREAKIISLKTLTPYNGDDISSGAHKEVPQGFKLFPVPQKEEAIN